MSARGRWVRSLPRVSLPLVGVALLGACGDSPVMFDEQFGEVTMEGLTYRVAQVTVAESFPIQIGVTVEVENTSGSTRAVVFPDGCVVLMRAYAEGSDPVWDMGDETACTLAIVQLELAPGETKLFSTSLVSAAEILGDGLPNGRYRMTAYLRPDMGEVEVTMGSIDLEQ